MDEEQIWEVYTTKHIVKTRKTKINIRGFGECQAVRVFLRPLGDVNLDHMTTPRKFQSALELHMER